jgi:hypothetical protein
VQLTVVLWKMKTNLIKSIFYWKLENRLLIHDSDGLLGSNLGKSGRHVFMFGGWDTEKTTENNLEPPPPKIGRLSARWSKNRLTLCKSDKAWWRCLVSPLFYRWLMHVKRDGGVYCLHFSTLSDSCVLLQLSMTTKYQLECS